MKEETKNTVVEETEEKAAEETVEKKPAKKEKPAKEKPGLLTRGKNWCKRNKNALIAGAGGVVAGVGGTIAVGEIAKRRAEKKARAAYIPDEQPQYSPLDPNVD